MRRSLFLILIILFSLSFHGYSQKKITVEEYISLYKDLAIEEMKQHHIPASITLAQGILESENGNSKLAIKANNHFGIKCHKEWSGKTFHQDDDKKNECFRKYAKPGDSYRDHSDFLSTRDRYNFLFDLDITDYKSWAYGLKKAGYATNPRYPELLIRIIEENELWKLDKVVSRQSSVVSQEPETRNQKPETENQKPELPSASRKVFEIAGRGGNDRVIFINNGVKFIIARESDSFYSIADEFSIYSWQLFVYNDMSKQDKIATGQKVYLTKKKRKAENESHIVQPGENLNSISQDYGIMLKSLCKLNNKKTAGKLVEGERLRLK